MSMGLELWAPDHRRAVMGTWVAGWNMPGYLPETDPEGFDTWQEAHAYIVGELERAWDMGEDEDYLEAHTQLHAAKPGEAYWVSVEGDRVRYWVERGSDWDDKLSAVGWLSDMQEAQDA